MWLPPFRLFQSVLVGLLAGFLLGGCDLLQDESGPPGEPISYEWVKRGYGVRVYEAQTRVFRDSLTWARFWNEHINLYDENHNPYPPPPLILTDESSSACTGATFIRVVKR